MRFSDAASLALTSLAAHKLRSLLTILGVFIGVASVIAVTSVTAGLDDFVARRILFLGSGTFYVQRMPDIITTQDEWVEVQKRPMVSLEDYAAVRERCRLCTDVGASVGVTGVAEFARISRSGVQIQGVTANLAYIGSPRGLLAGRHVTDDDIRTADLVAVLGADVADAFFGQREALGRRISVEGYELRVVGVAERRGKILGESQDNFVWLPLSTFRKYFDARASLTIHAAARSLRDFEAAQGEARGAMRQRRRLVYSEPDDFTIETGESLQGLWRTATQGIYFVTLAVTAMSLVIGGVVVMNIMLVSVSERVSEIGVRKALGARRGDIVRQFLVEAVVLSMCGGGLGVAGAALAAALGAAVLSDLLSIEFSAPLRGWAVVLALAVSGGVGLAAGIYPASRAASIQPVEALRAE